MLDHARARDAVCAALDFDAIGQSLRERGWEVIHVRSAAAIDTNIFVARTSGDAFRPLGARSSRANRTEVISSSSEPMGFQPKRSASTFCLRSIAFVLYWPLGV